jgi:hypothetical protein
LGNKVFGFYLTLTRSKDKVMRCDPECHGLAVFNNFDPPSGWVEVQRCDECNTYTNDNAAALTISKRAKWFNPYTRSQRTILTATDETDRAWLKKQQRVHSIVPAYDAWCFGLRFPLEKVNVGQRIMLRVEVDRYPHFIVNAGELGTVVTAQDNLVEVEMDNLIPGAEDWDNRVQWCDDLRVVFWEDCVEVMLSNVSKVVRDQASPTTSHTIPTDKVTERLNTLRCPKCRSTNTSLWYTEVIYHACQAVKGRLKVNEFRGNGSLDEENRFACNDCGFGDGNDDWLIPDWIKPLIDW